nr:hypothetical protein [Flavobacterium sp.]
MKRCFLLFTAIFITGIVTSQEKNITVILKNAITKDVIPGASVSVKDKGIGAVSNEDGLFKLSIA